MNGDLISRNALLKVIQEDKEFLQKGLSNDSEYAYMSADSVIEKIKSMPTAYNMDKVVERMNEYEAQAYLEGWKRTIEEMLEIVKSGGIE